MRTIKRTVLTLLAVTCVVIATPPARCLGQQEPDTPQRPPAEDPIRELNLSPEQRERIRAIREQLKEERAAIGQRLKEANEALDEALDADPPDEALLEQRMRDLTAAQAASMRLRVLSEIRIRRVLTPDQRRTWLFLRQNAKNMRRERQRENIRRQDLPAQRNSLGPLFPRRGGAQRRTRP
ncbi:MAG: Spy/CpxP family protein refolding chaperone [Pyrinomonadaceae bacterium]